MPRSICWQSKLLEATLHLLAKQAAGGFLFSIC
jgi:hypothetical protein